jgi:SOS-response transcriptional repressor LexA
MAHFTPTQGRYLAFIHAYIGLHGHPPSESEIAAAMCVSPPLVNQMVKMLEKKGLILRQPGHGPNDGVPGPRPKKGGKSADAHTTKLDDLKLELHCSFGYWFDFGDD